MISVFAFLVLAMIVLIRVPQSLQEVMPTAQLTPALPTPVNARSEFIADGRRVGIDVLKLDDGSLIEMVPWDGQSRYTIIVGGLDRRPDQAGEPVRTDSLMLVSIDPQTGRIGVLSIPRDLWVRIPGSGRARPDQPRLFHRREPGQRLRRAPASADGQLEFGHARSQLCPGGFPGGDRCCQSSWRDRGQHRLHDRRRAFSRYELWLRSLLSAGGDACYWMGETRFDSRAPATGITMCGGRSGSRWCFTRFASACSASTSCV